MKLCQALNLAAVASQDGLASDGRAAPQLPHADARVEAPAQEPRARHRACMTTARRVQRGGCECSSQWQRIASGDLICHKQCLVSWIMDTMGNQVCRDWSKVGFASLCLEQVRGTAILMTHLRALPGSACS